MPENAAFCLSLYFSSSADIPASAAQLFPDASPLQNPVNGVWTYDPLRKNGDNYGGLMNCYGMGSHIFTNTDAGDRMVIGQDFPFAGHTAEAYGLIGGMGFDSRKGNGIVYFIAGFRGDMHKCFGKYSAFYRPEEFLLTACVHFAQFAYWFQPLLSFPVREPWT